MQAVIVSGGLATRMRPLTLATPKAMLPVAGRPFIDWQLERLAAAGFDEVVLCVAFLAEQLRAHVKDGERWGVRVRFSDEGPTLLGTGGAVRNALPMLEPSFLVTYGDSYLPFDYSEPQRALDAHGDCDGVMSIFKNNGRWDASNVRSDGEWVLRYQKGTKDPTFDHIDYGAIAFRREVIAALPPAVHCGLDAVLQKLSDAGRLRACVARERFYEIGSPEGLTELDQLLTKRATS